MKAYVKKAVKDLQKSDELKIEITLKKKNDYKRNCFRIAYNKILFLAQTRIVPSHFKNWLLRSSRMNVGHDCCIPHYIKFDPYFPELIYLNKGCLVGGESHLITHQVKGKKLILGKNIVDERVLMGGLSSMLPGSKINKNSILMFFSDLEGEIPEGELWGGKPKAKKVMEFGKDMIDKFFIPSNGKHKKYYKEAREKINNFLEDPESTYLKIHYNGKRLNAGDDWWRARNFFRIWYNGILVEAARPLPHCWLKTLLFRMVGVKIGKNVKIGKGVIFDHLYGDLVSIGDNSVLEDRVYFDGHEYTITQTVFAKTNVGKNVHIKKGTYVRPGTQIGDNTTVEPYSFAQRDLEENSVYAGNPAKLIKKK
jgi:acetyltransferase-like isoleucine patch superfamily enzyme